MRLELDGKVALVTGSSRGLGLAIARRLHAEGCTVALNARADNALAVEVGHIGQRASAHIADVTSSPACEEMVRTTTARWGRLDILVCNVGSGKSVPPGTETPEEWQKVFAANLWSATNTIQAATESLSQTHGTIVCISSICGLEHLGAPLTYSAAKAALNSYVCGVARPLAKRGIRINAIAPGNLLFPGSVWEHKVAADPSGVAAMLEREVALGRFGTADEIADWVAFLASPRAAFATGSVFVVDGGQIKHTT